MLIYGLCGGLGKPCSRRRFVDISYVAPESRVMEFTEPLLYVSLYLRSAIVPFLHLLVGDIRGPNQTEFGSVVAWVGYLVGVEGLRPHLRIRTFRVNKFSRTARSVTFAAIVGLSMGVTAPAALAQDVENPLTTDVNNVAGISPLINKDAKGALTIHKKADPSETGTPSGNFDAKVNGSDLEGVGFTVYKINDVDMTTNEGLAKAAKVKASDYVQEGRADLEKVAQVGNGEQFTNDKGEIVLQDLAVGAYLVVETSPKEGYSPAAPFVAFVPMTQDNAEQGGVSWNYNVHAYPKNYSEKLPEKTVSDSGKNVGDQITYTVTAYAQTIDPATQTRTILRIEDQLDPKLTAPSKEDVKVAGFDAGDYTVEIDGQKVKVSFTAEGLKKVTNGQKIDVTIPAVVKEVGDGDVKNKAQVFENDPNTGEEKAPKDTPEVNTYYGGVEFNKVEAGTENGLKDAEFLVYGVKQNQTCDKASIDNQLLDQMKVNGKSDPYKSAPDTGLVTIDGLHVNDYADGQQKDNLYTSYCLVETKSPAGYELLAAPVEFKVLKENHGKIVKINDSGKIENLKDTTPNLPMTGGAGVGILAAIGAAIVAAGAWFARRTSNEA